MNIDLRLGDCIEVLKTIPDNSIDSIVTDPPYGIGFMNKEWDNPQKHQELIEREKKRSEERYAEGKSPAKAGFSTGVQPGLPIGGAKEGKWFQDWCELWARECYRVLKPGGHALSFAAPRTYHRMATAFEDSGFQIRDQIMWVFGSGFPKSLNIGKTMDKFVKTGNASWNGTGDSSNGALGFTKLQHKQGYRPDDYSNRHTNKEDITEELALQWEGWGTALKPAHEPIVMARKPLSEKSIVENVLKHGTGGINIDGSRIEIGDEKVPRLNVAYEHKANNNFGGGNDGRFGKTTMSQDGVTGRFPANIIFDEEAGKLLDEQSGPTSQGHWSKTKTTGYGEFGGGKSEYNGVGPKDKNKDKGGASRFFYCPKASKKDKNEGLDNFEDKALRVTSGGTRDYNARCANCGKKFIGPPEKICNCDEPVTDNQVFKNKNNHPTVKPTDLMRYLINLVTPVGGTILDPFMGSGSTGKAAVQCGVNFVGIEKEEEYMKIAEARIKHEKNKPTQQELF